MKEIEPKHSAASWLAELAKGRYGEYVLSILAALLGVACSLIPYFIIIRLITALVNGTAELTYCLTLCAWMAGFWVLRYVLHSVSTSLSHHATFHVLANTRTRLLDKLATLPLGTVLDRSSGSYKNIIVERVDSIETTLAHLLPEMTANIVGALAVLVLLFIEDWRMGLSMLMVVPLGIICFMSMFSGYQEKFQRTVTSTKALNDTAVEYISGIEVIKAFGQSRTSYAKFVSAAKEGADCFIDWMRGSLFGQVAGMAIFPSTLLGILPGGGGVQNLVRAAGMRRAKQLLFTGAAFDAQEALSLGLLNELTPKGQALDAAVRIARQMGQSAPMSLRYIKAAASRGGEVDFHTGYMMDIAAYNVLVSSQDRLEGVAAFNEKRAPRWKNR